MKKSIKPAKPATSAKKVGKSSPRAHRNTKHALKSPAPEPTARAQRPDSKLGIVIGMLRGTKGTTIEALSKATGWQTHSVRGAISGAIKNKLGLTVTSTKADGVRTYRINE